jgi:hypothetical protein
VSEVRVGRQCRTSAATPDLRGLTGHRAVDFGGGYPTSDVEKVSRATE